jgi:nucleotide-binding universal stress UspA family protein
MTAPTGTPKRNRIVVGVDGSDPSKAALRWAARIASPTGAVIEAVTAWQFMPNFGWPYAVPPGWDPADDAQKLLASTVESVFGTARPDQMQLISVEGNPAKTLLDRSDGAEMLVVGSRGHGGFVGLLLGSVSASCAEHATCPVLVVHSDPNSKQQ